MNIAIMENETCIGAAVFEDINTAQVFLADGAWPGATAVLELPDGHGIGDSYINGVWTKPPAPDEPEPEPSTEPTAEELLSIILGVDNDE
jgi:hypothetical protein